VLIGQSICLPISQFTDRRAKFGRRKEIKPAYLSNIRALKGCEAVLRGGGTLSTIASRISVIPVPS